VGGQDEEDCEYVEDPAAGVQQRDTMRSIYGYTEIYRSTQTDRDRQTSQ